MYFEVIGEETKKNKIDDLSLDTDETEEISFIAMVPKLSVGENAQSKVKELLSDIIGEQRREHMNEDESGFRAIPARIEFYIDQKDDKIILSGNLSHAFFILINAKVISQSFYESIRSNAEAKKLIDETSKYILPIHRIDDEDEIDEKDKKDCDPPQTIFHEIENLGRKIKELDKENRERAISALVSSVIENTSPEEQNRLSERFISAGASPGGMGVK